MSTQLNYSLYHIQNDCYAQTATFISTIKIYSFSPKFRRTFSMSLINPFNSGLSASRSSFCVSNIQDWQEDDIACSLALSK
jgi:hypothetical protein